VDEKLAESLRAEFANGLPKSSFKPFKALPKEGLKANQVNKRLQEMADLEMDIKTEGKYSGAVYSTDEDLVQLSKEASNRFLFSNLLFYELSQYSRQLEREVVAMLLNLFKGNSDCTGFTTSGGSESLQLAVLAHKRHYLTLKGITAPEIVLPETAHPALFKACDYYRVKPVVIPVGAGALVTVEDYRARITENTILLVCSAPNFMFGTFDPCKALGALALEKKVGCLLDIGIGSFLVPFAKENGVKLPEENYDFSVKGITAISIEPSKYGLAPVGMGCLLFGSDQLQKDLYWSKTDWCGYVYCSVNYTGSRSAGPIAVVWATMVYHGHLTYAKLALQVFNDTKALVEKLNQIDGVRVNGNPTVLSKLCSVEACPSRRRART
jgi:sphinganine-1-phosphate aldolase